MTISSLLSSYFQLPTGNDSSTGSQSSAAAATSMPSLADALAQVDQSGNNNSDSAFTLNLSPEAQSYLQSGNATSNTGSSTNALGGYGFVLSTDQQQKLTDIINQYKDAPFDQDTYDNIQNDLQAVGLAPQQLALQDQMRQFNPVNELVNALSGKSGGINPMNFGQGTPDENANANSYMQMIVNQWQTISSTAGAASGDSGTGTVAGASS